jgi:hypothetical protein
LTARTKWCGLKWKKQLAEELKANGINAVTAYNLYGPKYFQDLSEKEVLKKINGNNIDAVITINLVDKNKERQFVAGPRNGGGGYRYNPFLGGWVYKPYYMPYYRGGHFETNVNYNFETNLYSVADKKLIYSVETQSYDPSSISGLANDYSKSVVKDIKEEEHFNRDVGKKFGDKGCSKVGSLFCFITA